MLYYTFLYCETFWVRFLVGRSTLWFFTSYGIVCAHVIPAWLELRTKVIIILWNSLQRHLESRGTCVSVHSYPWSAGTLDGTNLPFSRLPAIGRFGHITARHLLAEHISSGPVLREVDTPKRLECEEVCHLELVLMACLPWATTAILRSS